MDSRVLTIGISVGKMCEIPPATDSLNELPTKTVYRVPKGVLRAASQNHSERSQGKKGGAGRKLQR
jgi:hypothetical protein